MSLHDSADRGAGPADAYAEQARLGKCIDCGELVDRREIGPDRRCDACHRRVFTRVVRQEKPAARRWWKRIRS